MCYATVSACVHVRVWCCGETQRGVSIKPALTPESGPACLAPRTHPLQDSTVARSAQDLGQRQERTEGWGRAGEGWQGQDDHCLGTN